MVRLYVARVFHLSFVYLTFCQCRIRAARACCASSVLSHYVSFNELQVDVVWRPRGHFERSVPFFLTSILAVSVACAFRSVSAFLNRFSRSPAVARAFRRFLHSVSFDADILVDLALFYVARVFHVLPFILPSVSAVCVRAVRHPYAGYACL